MGTRFIKNSIIFILKVKKLVKPVIDMIGRECQILGPWYCKLFKISTTVMWSIAIGYSCIITVYLPISSH